MEERKTKSPLPMASAVTLHLSVSQLLHHGLLRGQQEQEAAPGTRVPGSPPDSVNVLGSIRGAIHLHRGGGNRMNNEH